MTDQPRPETIKFFGLIDAAPRDGKIAVIVDAPEGSDLEQTLLAAAKTRRIGPFCIELLFPEEAMISLFEGLVTKLARLDDDHLRVDIRTAGEIHLGTVSRLGYPDDEEALRMAHVKAAMLHQEAAQKQLEEAVRIVELRRAALHEAEAVLQAASRNALDPDQAHEEPQEGERR